MGLFMESPYDPTDIDSIVKYAKRLIGKQLKDVVSFDFKDNVPKSRRKGVVGHAIEEFFKVDAGNLPVPDFREAGVELKILPLKRDRGQLRIKERTKISAINYEHLAKEIWDTASVRKKLEHILFIFYEYLPDASPGEYVTRGVYPYHASESDLLFFKKDWEAVWEAIKNGEAHLVSESWGKYLGACTAGRDSRDVVSQPRSDIKAMRRAFALKPPFTRHLWEDYRSHKRYDSLVEILRIKDASDFERVVEAHLRNYKGMTIGDLSRLFDLEPTRQKDYKQIIIRKCLYATDNTSRLEEFEKQGIIVRIFPVRESTRHPIEAISFPAFRFMEIINKTWESCDLREQTERILFVPLLGEPRKDKVGDYKLGNPFFWSPTPEQEAIMRKEWEMYVDLIREGKADELPTAKSRQIIHVRPHARDSRDTLPAPGGKQVVKKSFWLNTKFLKGLLEENEARTHGL